MDRVVVKFGIFLLLSTTLTYGQGGQTDNINEKIRSDFELIDYRLDKDTLTLISTSGFLYYPFGVFKDNKELKNKYPTLYLSKNDFSYLKYNNSYVKYFIDEDKKRLETVYAKIIDSEIKMINGIATRMSKADVMTKFFKTMPDNMDNIRVLKLESGLLGIWHYYTFDKNLLSLIVLDTDYQFDKK